MNPKLLAALIILHALAHTVYLGQLFRWFTIPNLTFGGKSWLLDGIFANPPGSVVLASLIGLAMIGFMVAAIGLLGGASWSKGLLVVAAVLSSIAFILAWNGKVDKIMEQGVIGVVINIALIYLASR
ncbi:MAG TPA: hypothetical protein PKD55_05165 [Bellilinea sp.]|nr:hypothetical protein [Bellilinea sp.]